jgi:tripartite-type tricarboxylate transporter receptor subunit TctC
MKRRIAILMTGVALVGAALFAQSVQALAQAFPTKPIHLVVGNPPGGATDVIARTIGQPLGERLGQNIIVDHRPGANGNISAEVVANAAPNGHTILYANNSLVVINPHIYSKLAVDPMRDLIPVVTTITNQLVLAANPKVVPVDDFKSFVEFARKAKSPLFYASIGNGSQHHIAMELLKQRAGIDLTHVPYKGGGPASIAVIAGENHVMFGGTSAVQHIQSGKLKGLAVSGRKGWATMPDLPAIGDFYSGYLVTLWHGIFAPRGTPQPIIDKLRTELNAVLAMPQVKERLVSSGAGEPYITTPEEFAALMREDFDRYGSVIKSIGFKVD